jgi:glycine/D-amino acid oxidase-like deaminating enzyme
VDLVSGTPFWPLRNGLIASYPTLETSTTCEVAVLGAGITGALAAWYLAETGLDVLVVDKRDVAAGSTSASTSLLLYDTDNPLHTLAKLMGEDRAVRAFRAGRAALDTIARIDRRLGGGNEFRRTESLQGATRAAHIPGLRRELALRRAHGFDVEWWSRAQIERLSSLPYHAALLSRDAAQIDPHRFTHSLLRDAAARGARIRDRTRVTRRAATRRGITLHTEHGANIRARHLVVATGYEMAPYLADPLTELVATFALVTEPLAKAPGWPGDRLIWETAQPYVYLRRTADGRAMIGGYDEPECNPRRRDDLLDRKTALLERRFRKLFPEIRFDTACSWAGTFAETPDDLPYIGVHPRFPHTLFALGYGGNGITFGVIAAEIIRDLICEGKSRDADLFGFDRVSAE